jgi:hypothetical protein
MPLHAREVTGGMNIVPGYIVESRILSMKAMMCSCPRRGL